MQVPFSSSSGFTWAWRALGELGTLPCWGVNRPQVPRPVLPRPAGLTEGWEAVGRMQGCGRALSG